VKSLCIYEWKSWHGFLLPMVFKGATRVQARFGESSADLLQRLPPHAGVFAFHVNLTNTRRTPLRRASFARGLRARGIRMLNESVTDISKTRVHAVSAAARLNTTMAPRAGNPDEILIVKTNANYGGEKEKHLSTDLRRTLGLGARSRWLLGHDSYLIVPRREVRPEFWHSRQIVVERFIQNRDHVFYRAHKVLDHVIVSRMVNPAGIKKMLQQIRRTNWYLRLPALEPVHGPRPVPMRVIRTIETFSRAFALDVGSIDVLVDDDGEPYVIDVNASPYWGEKGYDHMLKFLAGGLRSSP
jgi:hypothetical protein